MESDKLEERILTWSVFVRSHPKWEQEMLRATSARAGKEHVILAYPDVSLRSAILWTENRFRIRCLTTWTRAWKQGWELDEICRFAMLETSFHGSRSFLREEEKRGATLLKRLLKQGLRFAFYERICRST